MRLADAQHFPQRSHDRLHEYIWVGTTVQFCDHLDASDTLKPYLRGRLLLMWEGRCEKSLLLLQASRGSWAPAWGPPTAVRAACLSLGTGQSLRDSSALSMAICIKCMGVQIIKIWKGTHTYSLAPSGLESLVTFKVGIFFLLW